MLFFNCQSSNCAIEQMWSTEPQKSGEARKKHLLNFSSLFSFYFFCDQCILMAFCMCQCMWTCMWMTLTCATQFLGVLHLSFHSNFYFVLTSLSNIAWLNVCCAVTWRRLSANLKKMCQQILFCGTMWCINKQMFFLHFSQINCAFNPSCH